LFALRLASRRNCGAGASIRAPPAATGSRHKKLNEQSRFRPGAAALRVPLCAHLLKSEFQPMLESQLSELQSGSLARIASAANAEELEQVRIDVLGRKGSFAQISKEMGKIPPEEKPRAGKLLNAAKQAVEAALEARHRDFADALLRARLDAEWLDLTVPPPGPRLGHLHPITQIQSEIEDLFRSLGFAILDGPEVETEYHNFDALNIPADHPARDMQDTFWLSDGNLLRTHTSPVQVRGMERFKPPLRMIAPGRVFRNESVDASHEHTFYQVEGMMIDRDVSVAHLIYFMKTLLTAIFKREVTVRLRPGFFPFVEPGFELDIHCLICDGAGCPVCKQSGWVELLPCGLVNPNVLRMSAIDPEEWNGFAFGLGLTRLVMMRYAIDDIRLLQGGDLRFLNQF
jgi:phenylalanyl-tRNA synthetase alpha chain